MSQWKYAIDVGEEWEKSEESYSAAGTGQAIVKKFIDEFQRLPEDVQQGATDLVSQLAELSEPDGFDNDTFNVLWQELYDWADANRVWLNTFRSGGNS